MSNSPENPVVLGFEDALRTLQQIVSDLEGGSITLDESLQRFEQGIGLLRRCYQVLEQAEQRIEQLVQLDDQGNCTLAPFDATATVDKPKPQTKPAARKPARPKEPDPAPPPEAAPFDTDDEGKLLF